MKNLSFVFALVISFVFIQSCQKDAINEPLNDEYSGKEAPQLPPAESFLMPFEAFSNVDDGEVKDRTITNWGYAAGNVLIWNSLLTAHLTVPVLSFFESFNHQAEYQGSGVWLWAYEVTDRGTTYQAELYGELLVNDEVKWDMYVTQVGGFARVHWYSGITSFDNSHANWMLNFDPADPKPFISIYFQRDLNSNLKTIRYTNIIPGAPGNGGYIEYKEGVGAGNGFDRSYDVFKVEIDNLLEINWDSVNKNGQVKDFEKFRDYDWHCWGTDLHDTDC